VQYEEIDNGEKLAESEASVGNSEEDNSTEKGKQEEYDEEEGKQDGDSNNDDFMEAFDNEKDLRYFNQNTQIEEEPAEED